MRMADAEKRISGIVSGFTDEEIRDCRRLSGGHINESYSLKCGGKEYILQGLREELFGKCTEKLEHNYRSYVRACKKADFAWELPRWIPDREGHFFFRDEDGLPWRMYEAIPGETLTAPFSREQIRACGEGLSKLHAILTETDEAPQPVLPKLHDLRAYYEEYRQAVKQTGMEKPFRDPALEELIGSRAEKLISEGLPGKHIIHGDARIGNGIFREGRMVAMIDLDTLMEGPRLLDIADCIRSCCMREGVPDPDGIGLFTEAYRKHAYPELSREEGEALPYALERVCFTLGLRYYTDHLRGNKYFKQDHPGRNLEKAAAYLRFSRENTGF